MDDGSFPMNAVTRPAGIASRATTVVSLPTTVECSVLATVIFPANAGGRPMDAATLPAGIDCLVLTIENLPDGLKIKKTRLFSLFLKDSGFCCVFICEGKQIFPSINTSTTTGKL